jgi:hypothetical protein
MRRGDLLLLMDWDVLKYKALARTRVTGHRGGKAVRANQLPFPGGGGDADQGWEWDDHPPLHAFLGVLSDYLVRNGLDREQAADLLRSPAFQVRLSRKWRAFVTSEVDYWAGRALVEDTSDRSVPTWDEDYVFDLYDRIRLVTRAESLAIANASKAWRTVRKRADEHGIEIEPVF